MAKDAPTDKQQRAIKTTSTDLRKIASRLKEAAEQVDAQAEKMKQEKVEFVMLEGRLGVEGAQGAFWQLSKLLASCHRKIKQF